MKAVIKETGETVEVTRIETTRIEGRLKGTHQICGLEELNFPCIDADWEQRRYELVKAAMQGYCANSLDFVVRTANSENIAQWSISTADAVIKQLKEGDEWNEFKDWYNGAIYGEQCIFRYEILDNGNVVPDYITAVWNDYTCDYINERLSEYFTNYKITHWKPINKPKGVEK